MDKKEITICIVEILAPRFTELGFSYKAPNIFQKTSGENIFQYEIGVNRSHGGYSLHLRLNLLNKILSKAVNTILKKVLTDERINYPSNWTPKVIADSIKVRTSGNIVAMLTDWRLFKDENESLQDFNARFSIWFFSFDYLDEKDGWKEELVISINFSQQWFKMVEEIDYLIDHTYYPGLYLAKRMNMTARLSERYNTLKKIEKSQQRDTTELQLFYKYLNDERP